jgi:hypothetical protein
MRILVRTSKWAIWARRLGSFALPLAIIPVFMHRQGLIPSATFQTTEVVAITVAVLALIAALAAFVRLWLTGDRGWGTATLGLFCSLVCLLPLAYGLVLLLRYPMLTDISTDPADPPLLATGLQSVPPSPDLAAAIEAAFPNAKTRSYPLGPAQVFALANALAQARGWEVRVRREPRSALDEGQIDAVATTLLGWRDEVAIRIRAAADGSSVAMRSASLSDVRDLGANGTRIEEFLVALDNEVTVMLRDTPAAAAPVAQPEPG